jgi:endonuclease V-like protein UPF0215 family
MPPLKHSRLGESEVINWMCKEFKIDAKLADAVFSSARHAKYAVMYNGRWRGDSLIGFFNWKDGGMENPKIKEPVVVSHHEEAAGERLATELKEVAEGKREINIDDKPMSLEEAKANFQRIKESLGL